jgi:hypothetical protein
MPFVLHGTTEKKNFARVSSHGCQCVALGQIRRKINFVPPLAPSDLAINEAPQKAVPKHIKTASRSLDRPSTNPRPI